MLILNAIWLSKHKKLYILTLTCRGTLQRFRGLVTQSSSTLDNQESSGCVITLLFCSLPKLKGSIEKSEFELCPTLLLDCTWHRFIFTWLYSLIENNDLSDNLKGSMEKREVLLDVEDISTKAN